MTTTFKDRAQIGIDRGIPVLPVAARQKFPPLGGPGWLDRLLTTQDQINTQSAETPAANCAFVAQAKIGGVWMLETDSNRLAKQYLQETGKKFTDTFTVRSINGGHRYYLHNDASISMGNIAQEEANGFSVRANNLYCLSPLSVHPSGGIYAISSDRPIVEAEPEMIAWIVSQKKAKKSITVGSPLAPAEKIPHGGINAYMLKVGGVLRNLNPSPERLEELLLDFVHQNCEPPIDEKKVRNMAKWLNTQEAQIEIAEESEPIKIAKLEDVEVLGMPDDIVPDCKLGEIFYDKLAHLFPIDFGWISLIHAAGVLVPPTPRTGLVVSSSDDLTNFYTALVGPTNCGKTTAWTHARLALGIREETMNYINLKSGSAETLFENIQKGRRDGSINDQLFIDVDELSYLFKKIGIEGASFAPVLTTGFYKKMQTMFMGKGKNVTLNCAMSWIGGIVTEEFEESFGSATIGGLYDRFMFGLCPTGYTLSYNDFRGEPANVNPVPVTIDPSVFEVTKSWRKDHPELTREIELAVRFAKVIASFDRRPVLYGKDLEGAPLIFAMEQSRIRKTLKPNAGDNPDAKFANAIMSLLRRKAKSGEWVDMRTLKQHLNVIRENLGPNVMERAINGLLRAGDIEINTDKTRRNGKTFYRLAVEE